MDAVAMEDNKTATGECDSLAAMSDEEEYLAMQLEEVKWLFLCTAVICIRWDHLGFFYVKKALGNHLSTVPWRHDIGNLDIV